MPAPPAPARPIAIALAGLFALAVAMGIGRFAFTPLLPIMMAEGSVTLPGASLLASANYFGYLLGAVACTFQPWIWARLGWASHVNGPALVRVGLAATALLTAAMAFHWPAGWVLWRFAAGLASAVVFLYTSGFCLEQLARRGVPDTGALIYVGPGLGIVASGLAASAMVALHAQAALGWLVFGVFAAVLSAAVWKVFDARAAVPASAPATAAKGAGTATPEAGGMEMALLSLAYGIAGIGYIVTATFLPVIARLALPGSHWLDLFWPLFGLGVIIGALVASRLRGGDLRLRLAACYAIQAAGVAASLVSPTLAGFALGSLLLGLPFTAITFFAMQEARRIRPRHATSLMGLMTAMWGLGQILGPPMAAALVAHSRSTAEGFDRSLWIATGALLAGMALYGLQAWLYPQRTSGSR
ncbi:MFS transporter [Ramlibacter sp. XY19]|uniref:YbfB/YjiJ family MFS transporter n=1 Tax=Ramlibacter paludis TaxID=2908000 RepID=UPI0023DC513D|nr:YbfB/YjiJ family MFS transporter [Ramlibacter paludis]MCG2595080.1 MFS transporter [Ramlibacter paludis]